MYFLIGLNTNGDSIIYWIVNLFTALLCVESLMMAIAAVSGLDCFQGMSPGHGDSSKRVR